MKSRAESTNFQETSRYADVVKFFTELAAASPLIRQETFGHSVEGRALPLVILADPPVAHPQEAVAAGKTIVFVMANIHAGEVEGKEALQPLALRIARGDLHPLLQNLVILFAPIYNADGNERIDVHNRTDQYGPVGGVGIRENARGLDLNRDYMKLEAPESKSLVALFNRWDPHLTVDLHTTDGSYHAYHLTYSPTLNPCADPRLIAFERDQLLPAVTSAMRLRHNFRTYYYGNFSTREALGSELERFAAARPGEPVVTKVWRTFDHRPRFGNNYVGLRNRLTILSEAYSHLDFPGRVKVTGAFVEEILQYANAHAGEIRALTHQVDVDQSHPGNAARPPLGVEFSLHPLPEEVDLLVGDVTQIKHPVTGIPMIAMVEDKVVPTRMPDYGAFAATRTVPGAHAYLFAPAPGMTNVLSNLREHGVRVEELTAPLTVPADKFHLTDVKHAARPFAGHRATRLTGKFVTETQTFPEGTVIVRCTQPLGRLVAYLLEPESDDGLVTWNFLDEQLRVGQDYPIWKVVESIANAPTRVVAPPPAANQPAR